MHTEGNFQGHVVDELVTHGGWTQRPASDVDKETRLVSADLFDFLAATQPNAVEQLARRAGPDWQDKLIDIISKELNKRPGQVLQLLRHGKKILGVHLSFAYFKPTHRLNPETVARYEANLLTAVREVPVRKPDGSWGELDIGLYVNGLPVADAEMKNSATGTDVNAAVSQYRRERDHRDTHLALRAVVHFAFDTDAVMMATTLAGPKTRFLPFNRGSEPDGTGGAGNYDSGDGSHRTSYLWRTIWQRDVWLDILNRFIHITPADPDDPTSEPTLIFPRFHQWDAVTRLEAHAAAHGAGHNYLVQHSAGSGKSNTIGWAAHRLANLHNASDERVFDKVVVITDRRVLDRQLQAVVAQFERAGAQGMVRTVDKHSDQLADALQSPSTKIIVTTLQKFPFVLNKVSELAGSRFAVLIDEAHSSQSGESAKKMKEVLTAASLEDAAAEEEADTDGDEDEVEAAVARSAAARGRQDNVSMFAFTATPKGKTLELFGTPTAEGDGTVRNRPFHLYAMRQAIEEGFILDVLRNYTTYKVFYKLAVEGTDKDVERSRAATAAARYATLHPHVIDQKVEIIVEHFREHVAGKIGGHAKAMIVTRSRLHAVRYKRHVDAYISRYGYDDELGALVAFSGRVIDPELPGEPYTEASMNGFPDTQTADKFDTDDYQVMIVAEKYQTGFDQPLLHTMYVDKPLKNVAAVQTLQRLNRIHPLKDDTFVLDFVNDPDDIAEAFQPFYSGAVGVQTDPQLLYEAWQRVEDLLVISAEDVAQFAAVWFTADPTDTSVHPKLHALLRPAEQRFTALDEDQQEEFRAALGQFLRMYAFLAQVLNFTDTDLERSYAYGKMLSRRIADRGGISLDLSSELELTHVRLVDRGTADLSLAAEESEQYAFTGEGVGPLTEEEQVLLSEVVELINEKFGADLTDADKVFFQGIGETMADDPELQQQAAANTEDNFRFAFDDAFMDAVIEGMERNTDLAKKLLDDDRFAGIVKTWLLRYVHRRAQQKHQHPELGLGPDAAPA